MAACRAGLTILGFGVDDKAVYVTNNMFAFGGGFTGVRLWIIDKTWYGGPDQSAVVTVHDPITGGAFGLTMQPAHMYGAPPIGSTGSPLGTFLCGYSGVTFGGPGGIEVLQIIEVTDPLGGGGGPFFTLQFVECDDIEDIGGAFGFPPLADAPQLGTALRD